MLVRPRAHHRDRLLPPSTSAAYDPSSTTDRSLARIRRPVARGLGYLAAHTLSNPSAHHFTTPLPISVVGASSTSHRRHGRLLQQLDAGIAFAPLLPRLDQEHVDAKGFHSREDRTPKSTTTTSTTTGFSSPPVTSCAADRRRCTSPPCGHLSSSLGERNLRSPLALSP